MKEVRLPKYLPVLVAIPIIAIMIGLVSLLVESPDHRAEMAQRVFRKDKINQVKALTDQEISNLSQSYRMSQYAEKENLYRFFYDSRIWQLSKDSANFGPGVQLHLKENLLELGDEDFTEPPAIIIKVRPFNAGERLEDVAARLMSEIERVWESTGIAISRYDINGSTISIDASNGTTAEQKTKIKFYYLAHSNGRLYEFITMAVEGEYKSASKFIRVVVASFEAFDDRLKFEAALVNPPPELVREIYNIPAVE